MESLGASRVDCDSNWHGDETPGICFTVTVSQPLPDFAETIEPVLVSADLTEVTGSQSCGVLTNIAPSVMGGCSIQLDGKLRAAGYKSVLIFAAYSTDQLLALKNGADAYPSRYQVVLKFPQTSLVGSS